MGSARTGGPAEPAGAHGGEYFTVGHSTRSVSELAALLKEARADFIADVRTIPRSAANPQFNRDCFCKALSDLGIGYLYIPALGGLRARQAGKGPSPNGFWDNPSFRNYADYALSGEFRAGLQRLRELACSHRPAILCAEAVWWRCHRRIIADYLLAAGADVRHILGPGRIVPARMTAAAVVQPDGRILYPPPQ